MAGIERSRLLLDRGLANQVEGDHEAALADLTTALQARTLSLPEQARAFLERGLVMDSMNRLDGAVDDYGAALRLEPDSATALNNRANAFRRQNRFEDAKRDYLASLTAGNPAPEYPFYGLGLIAEAQGRNDEARNFYARALAANPGYGLAAERLTALGGILTAVMPVTLRPPSMLASAAPLSHVNPAAPAASDAQPSLRPALDSPPGQEVQLGAWRREAEAMAGWAHAHKAAEGRLSGLAPHIVMIDLPGRGRYYRLRVRVPDARQLCGALTNKGLPCIPARN
jgi:tetratricopeptide (TPR) repeat protein